MLLRRLVVAPERGMESWFGWLERKVLARGGGQPGRAVDVGPGGIVISAGDGRAGRQAIAWDEVVRVTGYRRVRVMGAPVCLQLELGAGGAVELDEEMGGWSELCDELSEQLPGTPRWEDWFIDLARGAGACSRLLFERRPIR
jgi:hypothetical protein